LRLKTTLITKERLIDQKLPTSLRVWTDAEYRATLNSPQPERLKTDSDGFTHRADAQKIIPKQAIFVNEKIDIQQHIMIEKSIETPTKTKNK